MKRLVSVVCAALFIVTGCKSGGADEAAPAPSALTAVSEAPSVVADPSSGAASPSTASSPTSDALVITVDGAGPYKHGDTLTHLQSAGLLKDRVSGGEACPSFWGANGTGKWTGVQLWFQSDGKLDFVIARENTISTPSGAKVGMTLNQLKSIYGAKGEVLSNSGAKAYLVVASGKALYFELDQENTKVFAILAGGADRLKSRFLDGADC